MSRNESDKEDLIREATALVQRAEYAFVHENHSDEEARTSATEHNSGNTSTSGDPATSNARLVTAGFRRDGSLSIYFDQDPFYQFDSEGRLRRALEAGDLFRSQQDTLARLTRVRSDTQTTLQRTDLSCAELDRFRERLQAAVTAFRDGLQDGRYVQQRTAGSDDGFSERLRNHLNLILSPSSRFLSANINQRA